MRNLNPDLIQSWIDFRILNALTQEPLYRSDIEQRVEGEVRRFFEFDRALILKALQRMESSGWLEAEWRQTEDSKQERIYSITSAGREQLKAEWEIRQSALVQFIEEGKWPTFHSQKPKPDSWN